MQKAIKQKRIITNGISYMHSFCFNDSHNISCDKDLYILTVLLYSVRAEADTNRPSNFFELSINKKRMLASSKTLMW